MTAYIVISKVCLESTLISNQSSSRKGVDAFTILRTQIRIDGGKYSSRIRLESPGNNLRPVDIGTHEFIACTLQKYYNIGNAMMLDQARTRMKAVELQIPPTDSATRPLYIRASRRSLHGRRRQANNSMTYSNNREEARDGGTNHTRSSFDPLSISARARDYIEPGLQRQEIAFASERRHEIECIADRQDGHSTSTEIPVAPSHSQESGLESLTQQRRGRPCSAGLRLSMNSVHEQGESTPRHVDIYRSRENFHGMRNYAVNNSVLISGYE